MAVTLDYFKSHPLRVAKNQRDIPIQYVRGAEKTSVCSDEIHPTAGAYIHYGGVELADMLRITQPSIDQNILQAMTEDWYASCGQVVKQLMFYVSCIIVKELRHGSNAMTEKAFAGTNVDPDILSAVKAVTKSGSDFMHHVDAIGHKPIGLWVDAVERHFRHGGWKGAYGGAKWADIALVFKQYVDGQSSAMLASDRAWTLVHNTGPIFNKGFYFEYHDGMLANVLNAQATSSVFTLADKIENSSSYEHEVMQRFLSFKMHAVSAIQTVKPDYVLGSTGGVTSDGQKGLLFGPDKSTPEKTGVVSKKLGSFTFHATKGRPD